MIVKAQVEITYEVPDNLQRENLWKSGLVFIDNEFYKTITKKVIAMDIMPKEKETVFQDAINVYGIPSQLNMMKEECAELIVAISHHERAKNKLNRETEDFNVVTELADVAIMLEQMKILFGDAVFNNEYNQKLARLREWIKRKWDND